MKLIERHGTTSWGSEEMPEPPYSGKVHLIIEDIHGDPTDNCYVACGTGPHGKDYTESLFVDFVDAPVTCKRCLNMTPQGIRKVKKQIWEVTG